MSSCVQCGSPVPAGQRTCSMCYGDPDHGRDGYYRKFLEDQEEDYRRRQAEREHEEQQQGMDE